MPNTQKVYKCNCSGSGVMINHFPEEGEVNLCIWQYAYAKPSFLTRLQWAWRVITKGTPNEDDIILDHATANELAKDILEMTKES
jgi:hypothetical protein